MPLKEFLKLAKQFNCKANEVVSEWINDVNIRIEASRRFKKLKETKSIKQFESEYLNHF